MVCLWEFKTKGKEKEKKWGKKIRNPTVVTIDLKTVRENRLWQTIDYKGEGRGKKRETIGKYKGEGEEGHDIVESRKWGGYAIK